jgi:serine/threonine protein kinase
MSPEQARGEPADFASDLFMAGIIGYLLLTGKHPFSHPSGLFTIPELLRNPDYPGTAEAFLNLHTRQS